jgi:hypothetical protein
MRWGEEPRMDSGGALRRCGMGIAIAREDGRKRLMAPPILRMERFNPHRSTMHGEGCRRAPVIRPG